MAVAFRSAGTAVEASGTSVTFSYTLTEGDVLFAIVATLNGAPSGVTWNGTENMTQVGFQARPVDGGRDTSVWRLVGGTAGTHDIVASQAASGFIAGIGFAYSGVDTGTPTDGVVTDAELDGDTTLDVSVTSPSGDLAVVAAVTAEIALTFTPTNGTVQASDDTANAQFFVIDRAGQGGATQINGSFSANSAGFATVGFNLNAGGGAAGSAAVTGTAGDGCAEADIVSGGQTIVITLTGDTWVASGATFNAIRQDIIDGLDSAQSETNGWNAEVRDKEAVTAVVRTSDTVVTITLSAAAAYSITANETITVTVPATAVSGGNAIVATPTFTVTATASGTSKLLGLLGVGA